ncbi:MAG: CcdB family protein [Gammaproteobacteria bacterium]|nr:CcdB family protein [Gammaproteobacteria bacterium]MBT8151842.1 CcdB family protein [Gammaproteobacteria bacterium]NND38247.1 CcdB family protein [Pseudomonadales bacterium]NNM11079.1 CcdB family protein [Pseudomonadales bacterium]RZV54592.1 MAG: plasmid maintenance protein CcdB [Pseudomonadales bacterium]
MAQFDVYKNPSRATSKYFPYLVDIQSPYLEELATRIVIPLAKAADFKQSVMKGLTPKIFFEGEDLLFLTPQISSMPRKPLKDPVGSVAHLREELLNSLDFALLGI